ncbi:MAG TPA: hypothetical protein VLE54_06690, partial [Thermoanaerobaculia bacterium]|nr:hypothetical protein [Thermoanaerobaculia bacterium]
FTEVRSTTDFAMQNNFWKNYFARKQPSDRLLSFVERVSHIGLLDHERAGVLSCASCRADARWIRDEARVLLEGFKRGT